MVSSCWAGMGRRLSCALMTFMSALLVAGWQGADAAQATHFPPDQVCVQLLMQECIENPVDLPPEPDQFCVQLLLDHCVDNPALVLDEDGDPPTATFIPGDPRVAGMSWPLGQVTGVILAYAEGQIGPLSAEAAAALEGIAPPPDYGTLSHAPTSTGSCDFRGPNLYRARDYDRAKRGEPSVFYGSIVGQDCTNAVASASCYTELWRVRDSAILENDSKTDSPGPGECWAATYSNFYVRPNKHYSKNVLRATTKPGGFWGSGRGPRGWDCSGQRTRTLTCRRDTPPES
jgi:hypothetical protein